MATTQSDKTIINRGLALFGGGSIQSLDEVSDLAAICAQIYEGRRDYLLSIRPWRFAQGKRELAKSADKKPINEWDNAFKLPENMLSGPWAVFGDGAQISSSCYEIYEGYLFCDYNTVVIDYQRRVAESEMPPWFTELLALDFGSYAAVPVSDQVSKGNVLRREALDALSEAKRLDGQTQPIRSLFSRGDPLTAARFAGVTPSVEGEV